jgi:hypothetical protein
MGASRKSKSAGLQWCFMHAQGAGGAGTLEVYADSVEARQIRRPGEPGLSRRAGSLHQGKDLAPGYPARPPVALVIA